MSKSHVKKGDQVKVIAGNQKGKTGTVTLVNASKQTVVVEGVRPVKKAIRRSEQEPDGGIKTVDGAIHISNVQKLG